jgi:translation initiation factor IF-3
LAAYRRSGFRGKGRRGLPAKPDAHRINKRISATNVRLILDGGEQKEIISIHEAMALAEEAGLDLVEVSPNADPPVCKLMDYGKFKYREQKKEAEARKKRSETSIKELRIRYRTDQGDLDTKLKKARQFLSEGDKVKFSMRFRGREIMYVDLGVEKFQEIIDALGDVADVDERSPASGRQIYIVLAPTKSTAKA